MIVFLTSSPTGPLDNSRMVNGLDYKNQLIENLHKYWKPAAKCLMITAAPADPDFNNRIQDDMIGILFRCGFPFKTVDMWDDRTKDFSEETLCSYDVIFLCGGHVPTQNAFFKRIGLREKMKHFDGLVIGISAGTMNSADVVYAQPEHEGESVDPAYNRYPTGLGLTKVNILPHYQMTKNFELDGRRLFEDITYEDSYGKWFLVLPDGSYLLSVHGQETVWGEAYVIADGRLEKICEDDQILEVNHGEMCLGKGQ